MKKEDDIMAEYLLKGAKMLAKTCPDCGCPVFQVKDRTFCVVCAERKSEEPENTAGNVAAKTPDVLQEPAGVTGLSPSLVSALEQAIIILADRASREPEPERCRTLMEAVHEGAEALFLFTRG
ncbi:MAG: hypothetical protein LUQ69_07145 [Methanoregulaceae archaeon]|nr:hypothetical protein [Methanoregulaceae archaeon]